jgi:protein-S-isoprenylcysteine O-methyltransferase Ste14
MIGGLNAEEWLALQRAGFLIGPGLAAGGLLLICRPQPREAVGAMVAFLWQLPALLLLHLLASHFHWWSFAGERNMIAGLPIDVWIGWAIWWGPVAVFLNRWLSLPMIVAVSVLVDAATMPNLAPLVELGPNWLIGDAVAVAMCLAPALWIARLTRTDQNPRRRAMFHVLGWGGYMALVIPFCVLSYLGRPVGDLYRAPASLLDWCIVAAALFLLFIGVAATAEFARVGDGTPIPFDPPKRVVTSGPYAFMANPMQIISAFFMALLALYARSWGLALVALMFAIFDTVYATWYNRAHIALAMPEAWSSYRSAVKEWRLRWQPHVGGEAEILISPTGPARVVWDRLWPWLSRHLEGRFVVRTAPRQAFWRLIYRRPADGVEDHGVKAAARILEHGPAPLAMIAWLIRFPYLGGAAQRLSWLAIVMWRRRRSRMEAA